MELLGYLAFCCILIVLFIQQIKVYYTIQDNSRAYLSIRHRNLAIVLGIILCVVLLSGLLNIDELISSINHLNQLEWSKQIKANYASIHLGDGLLGNCEAFSTKLLTVLAPALIRIKAYSIEISPKRYKAWVGRYYTIQSLPTVETSLN